MSTTHTKPCGDCNGTGYKPYDRGAYACETCNTSGQAPDVEGQLRAELDSARAQLRGVTAKLTEVTGQRDAAVKAYVKQTDGRMPSCCPCCGGESLCDGCEPGCVLSDAIETVFPGATR